MARALIPGRTEGVGTSIQPERNTPAYLTFPRNPTSQRYQTTLPEPCPDPRLDHSETPYSRGGFRTKLSTRTRESCSPEIGRLRLMSSSRSSVGVGSLVVGAEVVADESFAVSFKVRDAPGRLRLCCRWSWCCRSAST